MTLRTAILSLATLLLAALGACSGDPVSTTTAGDQSGFDVTVESYSDAVSAICGRSDDEVYAGGSMLARWDGSVWRPLSLPPGSVYQIQSIWMSANEGMRIQFGERLWTLRQGTWDYIVTPSYRGVCALSDGSVFALSSRDLLLFDGARWTPQYHASDYLRGVWAERPDNIHVCGDRGFISHFDGSQWTSMTTDTTEYLESVVQCPQGTRYARGLSSRLYRVDGAELAPISPNGNFRAEYAWPGPNGLWAAGREFQPVRRGVVFHYDGATWTEVLVGEDYFFTGWTSPGGTVFAGGYDGVMMTDHGESRAILPRIGPLNEPFNSLWSSPEGDVIAAGQSVFRGSDRTWTDLHKQQLTDARVQGVSGLSSEDFYAVGDHMILHYDHGEWDWVNSGFQTWLVDVWVGADQVLAVGDAGRVVRKRGDRWDLAEVAPTFLNAVSGWAGGAYLVGYNGSIFRYDGEDWTRETSPTTVDLFDVAAFADGTAIAVGADNGAVFVRDTRSWKRLPVGVLAGTDYYTAVSATSRNDFFIGGGGSLVHYDGNDWAILAEHFSSSTYSIARAPRGDLLVSGESTLLRYHRR